MCLKILRGQTELGRCGLQKKGLLAVASKGMRKMPAHDSLPPKSLEVYLVRLYSNNVFYIELKLVDLGKRSLYSALADTGAN